MSSAAPFLLPQGVRALLLDVEGTTTPRAFVFDILFPFARAHLDEWLHATGRGHQEVLERLYAEHRTDVARGEQVPPWSSGADDRASAAAYLRWLMDRDRKSPALKMIQGEIWDRGYDDGRLRGQVFDDVPRALGRWTARGLGVYIYSSGSVQAQRRLFGSTGFGDLAPLISGYFDTAIGAKVDAESYRAIAHALPLEPGALLFFSDVTAELDAARRAGLETVLVCRPGNPPPPAHTHPSIVNFDEICA